jgi:hypothetical protein
MLERTRHTLLSLEPELQENVYFYTTGPSLEALYSRGQETPCF